MTGTIDSLDRVLSHESARLVAKGNLKFDEIEEQIRKQALEKAEQCQTLNLDDRELESKFNEIWNHAVFTLPNCKNIMVNVTADFEEELRSKHFPEDKHLVRNEIEKAKCQSHLCLKTVNSIDKKTHYN